MKMSMERERNPHDIDIGGKKKHDKDEENNNFVHDQRIREILL